MDIPLPSTFTQIIASTVLAGELSLMAALCTDDLVSSHLKLNRYGRGTVIDWVTVEYCKTLASYLVGNMDHSKLYSKLVRRFAPSFFVLHVRMKLALSRRI